MVFNILVYNNDDHLRNFGFVYAGKDRWNLSKLYDVVPAAVNSQTYSLAMTVGLEGKKASLSNAFSQHERFRISSDTAKKIIKNMQKVVGTWHEHFKKCGVSESEISALENSFLLKP
jgi:serine/threonine-protein kinase HipA